MPYEELCDTAETAKRLGLSESCLNKWRVTGFGPRFIKLGKAVKYRWPDVLAWLDEQSRHSTSEAREVA
jgi:predicted DNA-binding transcriptional regulator AlpA